MKIKKMVFWLCLLSFTAMPIDSIAGEENEDGKDIEYEAVRQPAIIQEDLTNASSKVIDYALKKNKQEQEDTEEKIALLDQMIEESAVRLKEIQQQKKEATEKYLNFKALLSDNEQKLEKIKGLTYSRIRAMYQMQNYGFVDLVLNAKGFIDFLYKYSLGEYIIENDLQIIGRYKEIEQELARQRIEAEAQFIRMINLEQEEVTVQEKNRMQKAEKMVFLEKLKKQEGELIEIREEQLYQMNTMITSLQSNYISDENLETLGKGIYHWPTNKYLVSSKFGYRTDPITGEKSFHGGIDIPNNEGAPIYAIDNGVIMMTGYIKGYGNTISIYHGKGIVSIYGHIRNGGIRVKPGQQVKVGEIIGEVGSTGRSTGSHVHVELLVHGQRKDPIDYLRAKTLN
jgi:murein DD-endopeptidase MepM/ murein hydrolase activator NlpD